MNESRNSLALASSDSIVELTSRPAEFPIVIAFPKSTSIVYPTAIATAKAASRYHEVMDGANLSLHLAAFAADRHQFALAQSLCRLVLGLRGVQIYVNGIHQSDQEWRFIDVLECFLRSFSAQDWRAHCQVVVDNPFTETWSGKAGPYLLPCHYIYRHGSQGHALSKAHPSSLTQQIQASAARVGCSWCPNFHPEDFRKLDAP